MDALPTFTNDELTALHALRKGLPIGKTIGLDTSDPTSTAAIAAALRASDLTAIDFPVLHSGLDAGSPAGAMASYEVKLVDAGTTSSGKATATTWTGVSGVPQIVGGLTLAFDRASGALVAAGENTAVKSGFLTAPTRAAQAAPAPAAGLDILHIGHGVDAQSTQFFALAAAADVGGTDDPGIQAIVNDPKPNKPGHTVVQIAMGRVQGSSNPDCDYVYYTPDGQQNDPDPFLIVPFTGYVSLSGTPNLGGLTGENFVSNVIMDNNGVQSNPIALSSYTTAQALVAGVSPMDGGPPNQISWSYPYDGPNTWYQSTKSLVYNRSGLQSELTSYFYFAFNIPMADGTNEQFYVCSDDSPEEPSKNCTKVRNLMFWWHCAVKGTPVTLEDGSTLPIEDVHNGHRVRSAGGRSLAVRATRYGGHRSVKTATGEAAAYRVETESGHRLEASGGHLIALADGGYAPLSRVATGDRVLTQDGPAQVVAVDVIAFEGTCYSLGLGSVDELASGACPRDGATYFAGGIGCGDHFAMRAHALKAREDVKTVLAGADQRLHTDLRSALARKRF